MADLSEGDARELAAIRDCAGDMRQMYTGRREVLFLLRLYDAATEARDRALGDAVVIGEALADVMASGVSYSACDYAEMQVSRASIAAANNALRSATSGTALLEEVKRLREVAAAARVFSETHEDDCSYPQVFAALEDALSALDNPSTDRSEKEKR